MLFNKSAILHLEITVVVFYFLLVQVFDNVELTIDELSCLYLNVLVTMKTM